MIFCPSCNTECPENANFCLHCGTPLKTNSKEETHKEFDTPASSETMTQALKRLMPTSYVEKLLASKGKMEGERRVVTILFSDVKGSTALAENLDPEEVLEVMNGAFNVLIEPITRYEGTIARLMGDAILAFFGAPIAHEDDPYRACRAALDILEGAKEFSKKLELEKGIKGFGVRVGINTGLVVVAEVGTDLRVEYTAMGDAVNIAARMESSAETGTILITEATKKLIQKEFDLSFVGPIQVKGKTEPINTYRVLDIKKNESVLQHSARFHSLLIGREKELKKIQDALYNLQQGTGKIISVIGERGVGKSRLVTEIRKQEYSGLKWVEGRALTYTFNNSYWMIRCILKNLLGYHQESSDTTLIETLYKKVEIHFGDKVEDIYPFIEHYLKPLGETNEKVNSDFKDPHATKGRFHYAVKELIKKESQLQPIVMVWEDLQWCDLPSIELLNELLPLAGQSSIILLLQYRLDENEKRAWNFHHNNLNEYSEIHELMPLHPLGEKESALFIKNLIGNYHMPTEIQNQVIEKSEGNPSFLEEVIHSIMEGDFSKQENHSSETTNFRGEFQIPSLLQNVIMARVDRLEPADKITLQTASVIGRVFQKKLLANIMADNLSDSELESSLNELQLREFLLRHLPTNITPRAVSLQKEYIFKQDIAQNVVYNSLLLSHRRSLHRRIGEEIENLYPDNCDEFANSLAAHFEKGNVLNKAIYYFRVAADRAKDLFANEDAIYFYSQTLRLAEDVRLESADLAQIHESVGEVFSLMAEYSKAINHFNLSLNQYKSPGSLAKVYYKCGQIFERWGNYEKAMDNYNKGLYIVNSGDEEILKAHIYAGIGMVYYRQANLTEAEKFNTQALITLKECGNKVGIADVYNNFGIIYGKLGDLDKSLEFHNKCLHIREQLGNSSGLAASNNNLGYLHQLKNDLEKAVEYYNKSLEYCEKIGNLHGLARTYDNLSHIYITQGKQEMAMDYNLKAIAIFGKIAKEESLINSDIWLQSGVW